MAGKKASGKTYTSKGERISSMRTSTHGANSADKMLNKLAALAKGKDVTLTLENPNKAETNKRFIKYKISGKAYQKYMQGGAEMKGARNPLLALGE